MTRVHANTLTKWIGLAAGIALAAVLLSSWRVPATSGTLGADLKLVATPPGELTLKPAGALLQGHGLRAGGTAATGTLEVRNITARTLAVRTRLLPSVPDLDAGLRVEVEDGGRPVASGPLGRLRRWSRAAVTIAPGESRRLDARAAVVPGARDYQGRIVDATLELRATQAKR